MNILEINTNNILYLEKFISLFNKNDNNLIYFRYFNNKLIDKITEYHYKTLLYIINDTPVGYAHIDFDIINNKYWFGICVLEEYQGKGIGTKLINYVINIFKTSNINKLYLTVDINNTKALKLYTKHNFNILRSNKTSHLMVINKNNILNLPVSYGEALDKLSILDIKSQKITDNRKNDVVYEYNLLYNKLHTIINKCTIYYNLLKQINIQIWNDQDLFRYSNNDNYKNNLCKQIIEYNDRRFRVKNKINNLLNSSIKEQKGYKPSKLLLITHNELGDIINHCGMIRYYSTIYDEVKVVCRNDYQKQLEYMFEDDKSIVFYPKPKYLYNNTSILSKDEILILEKEYTIKKLGAHLLDPKQHYYHILPYNFYKNANIDYRIFWDYYYFRETDESIRFYTLLKENNIMEYVFIHTSTSNGNTFDYNYIKNKLNINKDNTLIINSEYNIYDNNHKFYNIANVFVMKKILDYYTTIQNASYVILTDSCIFCLSLHIPIKTSHCYFVNGRYGNYSTYIYNNEYGFNENLGLQKFRML